MDRTTYANYFLSGLIYTDERREVGGKLMQLRVTDCRSLYDAVISDNPALIEKRSIRDFCGWPTCALGSVCVGFPTHQMFADGLAEVQKQLQDEFCEWLKKPFVQLSDCQDEKENTPV